MCDGGGIQIVITEPQVDELKYNVATGVFDEVRIISLGRPSIYYLLSTCKYVS